MLATAETINFEADLAAAEQVPARTAEPFDIGSTVVPLAIYKDPAEGLAEAQARSLGRCTRLILKPPHLVEAVMSNPGAHEQTLIKLSFQAVGGCVGRERLSQYRPQIERNGHWIDTSKPKWYPIRMGGRRSNEGHESVIVDTATQGIYPRCVNGRREPARLKVRNQMRLAGSSKISATGKTKTWPIEFDPKTTISC